MRMRLHVLAVTIAAVGALGSGCKDETELGKVEVFSGHNFLRTDKAPTKSIGEDCAEGGQAECKDRGAVCFHYQADPERGYVCSVPCASDIECPESWCCESVVPSMPGSSFCVPPKEWVPAKGTVRRSKSELLK